MYYKHIAHREETEVTLNIHGWGFLFIISTNNTLAYKNTKMAALSSEFGDLVQIKKQLISVISLCKERGLLHSAKW